MSLTAGIVGLPNVGKSTLFNAITNSHVIAENYPFATIEPNSGVVEVKDPRFDELVHLFDPKKEVRATIEFTDIAGLVKGASKGEGLGNQFLASIRLSDAIVHMVRAFENPEIIHVEDSIDPVRDIEIINYELIMADLDVLMKRLQKQEKKALVSHDPDANQEIIVLKKIVATLEQGICAREDEYSEKELEIIKEFNLLTMKPVIFVANVSESDYQNPDDSKYYRAVKEYAKEHHSEVIPICAEVEASLQESTEEEKHEYLSLLGASYTGLDKLTKATYDLLGLKTFFTVGSDEVRAWTFHNGMKAPACAGIIHTDFQKGFIKAEVYNYTDIIEYKTEGKLKEAGKILTVGKEYQVADGDCLLIRFNVTK